MLASALRLAALRSSALARTATKKVVPGKKVARAEEIPSAASAATDGEATVSAGPLPPSAVPYGLADFAVVSKQLYFDRTHYIPVLERKWGRAAVMLRPRRFGKSLFVSMLDYYYNVDHANRYKELFGHLRVSSHRPTDPRDAPGSWLVLRMNFSDIHGDDAATFDTQLHKTVNSHVAAFRRVYSEKLKRTFDLDPTDGATSLQELINCVQEDPEYKRRLLVLIDEYDSSVNVALRNSRLLSHLLVDRPGRGADANAAGSQPGELTPERVTSPFRRIFAKLKAGLELGGLGRVYVTGVTPVALNDFTSGFNVAKDLSTDPGFAELFGFTEAEVRQALERVRPAHATLSVDDAVEQMRREFNGYRFTDEVPLESGVYNSTQVLHYVKHYACTGEAPYAGDLVDHNVHPNNATLQLLRPQPRSLPLLNELLQATDTRTAAPGVLQSTVGVADMLDPRATAAMLPEKARNRMLSYLYFMGAVTFAPASAAAAGGGGPGFVIPHAASRRDFLDELYARVHPAFSQSALLVKAMRALVFDSDLGQLLDHLADTLWAGQGGNNVVHAREQSFKDQVHAVLLVASTLPKVVEALGGRSGPVASALAVPDGDSKLLHLDLVYAVPTRGLLVHIEFANATVKALAGWEGESWKDLHRRSQELAAMEEDELLQLKCDPVSFLYDNPMRRDGKERERRTLGDQWNCVRSQARERQQALQRPEAQAEVMRRMGKPSNGASQWQVESFAALRIGLHAVLCERVVHPLLPKFMAPQ